MRHWTGNCDTIAAVSMLAIYHVIVYTYIAVTVPCLESNEIFL
jgi:hypothetical protein